MLDKKTGWCYTICIKKGAKVMRAYRLAYELLAVILTKTVRLGDSVVRCAEMGA